MNDALSRAEAAKRGQSKYRTLKACKSGHFDYRYTNTGACVKCISNYAKKYAINRLKIANGLAHINIWVHEDDAPAIHKLIQRLKLARSLS